MATINYYPTAYIEAANLNRSLAAIARDPRRYREDDLAALYGLIQRTAARLSAVLLQREISPMLETRVENFHRAQDALHTLTSRRQAILQERAKLEAEIAELTAAITQTSESLQNPPISEIRVIRAKIKELTEQRADLMESLAIPALSTEDIDRKIKAATAQIDQLRRLVYVDRLNELVNEPEAKNATAFLSRMEALARLANTDIPRIADQKLVEQERQSWLTWLP